jgi:hypothetical protein
MSWRVGKVGKIELPAQLDLTLLSMEKRGLKPALPRPF